MFFIGEVDVSVFSKVYIGSYEVECDVGWLMSLCVLFVLVCFDQSGVCAVKVCCVDICWVCCGKFLWLVCACECWIYGVEWVLLGVVLL